MKTSFWRARVALALILVVANGCANVPPHLELPTLDIKPPKAGISPADPGRGDGCRHDVPSFT